MSSLATKVRSFVVIAGLLAAVGMYAVVSHRFRGGTEWYRSTRVTLIAGNARGRPTYVRFVVSSTTRGILEGNAPHGQYFPAPFSRTYVLHPQEKLGIQFTAGVNDRGNTVSCTVRTDGGTAAHREHVKGQGKDMQGAVPNDVNCNTSVVNI